jgi:CRP/FNR family transcriptional regulator
VTTPARSSTARKRLADSRDEPASCATSDCVTVTQADVAQLAGSSRESASRFLAVLERAGVVTQGRGRVTVHDPAALERYVY